MTAPNCPRCGLGVDSDGDGNCGICAHWSDEEVMMRMLAKGASWRTPTRPVCLGERRYTFTIDSIPAAYTGSLSSTVTVNGHTLELSDGDVVDVSTDPPTVIPE